MAAGRKDFMENLWLKIKIWTKILIFSVVVIYLGIFTYNNSDQPLTIWLLVRAQNSKPPLWK